jgi:hypothetical protein
VAGKERVCKNKAANKQLEKGFQMNDESMAASGCECVDKKEKPECKEGETLNCSADPDNCVCEKVKSTGFDGCNKIIPCAGELIYDVNAKTPQGYEIFCAEISGNASAVNTPLTTGRLIQTYGSKIFRLYSTKIFSKGLLTNKPLVPGTSYRGYGKVFEVIINYSSPDYNNENEMNVWRTWYSNNFHGIRNLFYSDSSRQWEFLEDKLCQDVCTIGSQEIKNTLKKLPGSEAILKGYKECVDSRKKRIKIKGATAECLADGTLITEIPDDDGNVQKKVEPNGCTPEVPTSEEQSWECKMNVCSGTLESGFWNSENALKNSVCMEAMKSALNWQVETQTKCKKPMDCTGRNGGRPLNILPKCEGTQQHAVMGIKAEVKLYLPCPAGTNVHTENEGLCHVVGAESTEQSTVEQSLIERPKNPKPYRYEFDNSTGTQVIESEGSLF